MKKILAITITNNRLDVTKRYIGQLREKAGYEYDHIIVDNGSIDGTPDWLEEQGFDVLRNKENEGIVSAWIKGVEYGIKKGYKPDYILKFDDDCEIATRGVLKEIMRFYAEVGDKYVVAPLDLEILPDYKPVVVRKIKKLGSFNVSVTTHTGGMFTVMPYNIFHIMAVRKIEKDIERGGFWRNNGIYSVYLNDLKVYHRGMGTNTRKYKF